MTTATVIAISPTDLETLIRRVVREVVHEELIHVAQPTPISILDDWRHEGPTDPQGDEELLQEALTVLTELKNKPEDWMSWEDFEKELDRAEAAGELPN